MRNDTWYILTKKMIGGEILRSRLLSRCVRYIYRGASVIRLLALDKQFCATRRPSKSLYEKHRSIFQPSIGENIPVLDWGNLDWGIEPQPHEIVQAKTVGGYYQCFALFPVTKTRTLLLGASGKDIH